MNATSRHWITAILVAAGLLAAAQVHAEPPARVARLNYLKGSVSFRPASLDDWAPATVNYPLTTGDHLWTDNGAWAELHVGSTAIRLAPGTAFAFLNLDDRATQVRLSEGALDVRMRNLDGSEVFEIDTPSSAVVLRRPGVYRVDVLPDGGSTRVTVRYGLAGVTADGPDFWVRDGETAAIYGTSEITHEIYRAAAPDSWEQWCRDRDERDDRAASVRYVSYEMTGYEDLDEYGTWNSLPEYGWAWRPRVAAGWAPYRYGQWRWVSPWGWTWVDEAPWGFAPFHYGRWACHRGGWYWVPGSYVVRPIYAPALVAFIGGANWGLSFGVGFGHSHLGWFPLAPGEFWMPHYRASHAYIRNLNVTNVNVTNINITNYDASRGTYVNRAIPGAVTAVPRDAFLGGRAVARDAVAIDSRAAMRASVMGTSADLAPRVDSVVGGRRTGYVTRPPSAALERSVVARSQPPAAPAPFSAQERAIQANGGRPLDDSAMARLRSEAGGRSESAPVRIAGARGGGLPGAGPARGEVPDGGVRGGAARGDQPATAPVTGNYGTAVRRGERISPDSSRPSTGQVTTGMARPDVNDRPTWARPRGGEVQPANPRYSGEAGGGAGVRGRPAPARTESGESIRGGMPVERPGGSAGEARPRGGDRTEPGSGNNDRPAFAMPRGSAAPAGRPSGGENNARPSGGESARPSGGENNARPSGPPPGARRGGDAQPAPGSKPPAGTAQPRPGGRGGESGAYEQSAAGRFYSSSSNDRPPQAGNWGGAAAARPSVSEAPRSYGNNRPDGVRPSWSNRPAAPESARPSAQDRPYPQSRPAPSYRPAPESRPTPQYRSIPESRPTPQYRSVPESRSMPQYGSAPAPRAVPQYRSIPESRPMPQYRSVPESRPMPDYRPRGGEMGSRPSSPPPAVRSYGGGERGPAAAPAPRPQAPSGGQAAPRGGARRRGGQ